MTHYVPFKIKYDLQQRIAKYQHQKQINQDLYPIIIQPNSYSKLKPLKNYRFCCQGNKTLFSLKSTISSKVYQKQSTNSFYLYVGKTLLVQGSKTMQSIYKQYKDDDGFLYLTYAEIQLFG